jgi:hypothetical protein
LPALKKMEVCAMVSPIKKILGYLTWLLSRSHVILNKDHNINHQIVTKFISDIDPCDSTNC